MTYPMPDPRPHPTGPNGPREMVTGVALYGEPHWCQVCGKPAEVFDLDGAWCTEAHRTADRMCEVAR